jgi:tetratricopeptide (TPR) repeat protein
MSNKEADTVLSPEENERVQRLFSQYHQIAELLRTSLDQEQALAALIVVNDLTEAAQIAFVKSLAKVHETDAADILAGVNIFSRLKEVRKAARRGLLRLESNKVLPQWKPPVTETPAVQASISHLPRFWKGFVSQSREEGEVQLLLCWEQGFEYNEIRLFSFVLNYWHDGIKDLSVETSSKRLINQRVHELRTRLPNNAIVDCTLAEGKRLIEEALSVNVWRNTEPHQNYRYQLPLLNTLIFQATDLGQDSANTFITPELEIQEVVANFLGAWTFGDFGLAYDLLTPDCEIRANLPRDQWIKQHQQWHQEAKPLRMELGFVHDMPPRQSALWLPPSIGRTIALQKKDIEVGWSVELVDTPLSGTLQEMPFATAINKETGRSWFWTSYSLAHVNNTWRIQKATDEGLALQALTPDDLQKRIQEQDAALEQLVQQQQQNPDIQTFFEDVSWRLAQLLHFHDTLITQFPLDYEICKQAYESAILTGNPERLIVYLERMTQRFSVERANNLRRLGSTLAGLADHDAERGMVERARQMLKRAEETLREAISIDEDALSHMLLGELLISENRNAEAEAELLMAKEQPHTDEIAAAIEAGLGNIAIRSERLADAVAHYQRVSALNPQYPDVWFSLGFAHRLLGQIDQAEQIYTHAIEIDPTDQRLYSELTAIYTSRNALDKAVDLLERGLRLIPDSAILHALIASVLFEQGNQHNAQRHLETAANINPELDIVKAVKEQMQV